MQLPHYQREIAPEVLCSNLLFNPFSVFSATSKTQYRRDLRLGDGLMFNPFVFPFSPRDNSARCMVLIHLLVLFSAQASARYSKFELLDERPEKNIPMSIMKIRNIVSFDLITS